MAYTDPALQRAASRKHYEANTERVKKRAKVHQKKSRGEARAWLLRYLLSRPCLDCGEADPVVLEFDHRGDKSFNIGAVSNANVSLARLEIEVAKCDVRCANCHRRKTYRERGLTHRG